MDTRRAVGFTEQLVRYLNAEQEQVTAFLLIPDGEGAFPGVVIHHQHNGERHLGKSEVVGRCGDPLQAFGPALARSGIAVLAPDAICFEDRRRNAVGTARACGDEAQHYNEAAYRLVSGSLLMSIVMADAALAVSVLSAVDAVDPRRIGAVGHSMGGHTVLFSAALDARVSFACISGAAGSYRRRIATNTGIELAQLIPGMLAIADFHDLLGLFAPRSVLVQSASEDVYSQDAEEIVDSARAAFAAGGSSDRLTHTRYEGGHALTRDRFDEIVNWTRTTASHPQASTAA